MSGLRAHASRVVRGTIGWVVRRPRVKRLARIVLDRVPALQTRLRAWVHRAPVAPPRRYHVPLDKHDLSTAVGAAFEELQRHVKGGKR